MCTYACMHVGVHLRLVSVEVALDLLGRLYSPLGIRKLRAQTADVAEDSVVLAVH